MKRLDEIPKKTLFEVPEGYFEKLPSRIQARISKPEPAVAWGKLTVRYALPALLVGAMAAVLLINQPNLSPEEVLASIESEQLVAYLEDTEINTEDLLEGVTLEADELDMLELDALGDFVLDESVMEEMSDTEDLVEDGQKP